jgi:hypothetical protein
MHRRFYVEKPILSNAGFSVPNGTIGMTRIIAIDLFRIFWAAIEITVAGPKMPYTPASYRY